LYSVFPALSSLSRASAPSSAPPSILRSDSSELQDYLFLSDCFCRRSPAQMVLVEARSEMRLEAARRPAAQALSSLIARQSPASCRGTFLRLVSGGDE